MRWGQRVTNREYGDLEAERDLDCLWESFLWLLHICASGEFYDMGWEKGKSQSFHLACSSVGAKKIIPRHYDSGFEKHFTGVKEERMKKFFIPICIRRSELVSLTLFTFCSWCAGKYFNNQLSGKIRIHIFVHT